MSSFFVNYSYEDLQKVFAEKGYTDVTFDFENLGDGDQVDQFMELKQKFLTSIYLNH